MTAKARTIISIILKLLTVGALLGGFLGCLFDAGGFIGSFYWIILLVFLVLGMSLSYLKIVNRLNKNK